MPLPFLLAALFGKAAVGAIVKGAAAKTSAVGAKGLVGHHAHQAKLAQEVAEKIAEQVADSSVDAARSRQRDTDEKA